MPSAPLEQVYKMMKIRKCFRDMLFIENKQNDRFKTKSAGTVFTFQYCLIRAPPSARLPRVRHVIHSPSKIVRRMTGTGHNPLWINLELAQVMNKHSQVKTELVL
jgi:hypothetical protein